MVGWLKLESKLNIFRNIYKVLMTEKHLTLENKENRKPTGDWKLT